MTDLFSDFWSSEWAKPIFLMLVILVTFILANIGRGKKSERNFDLISEKLDAQGFGKWVKLDYFVYIIMMFIFGYGFYSIITFLTTLQIPNDILYSGNSGFRYISLTAVFFGMTAPALLWVKYIKLIHKNRYRKYILYLMADEEMDLQNLYRNLIRPLCIITVLIGLFGSRTFEVVKGENIITSDFFELTTSQHSLKEIEDFLIVEKQVALSGNVRDRSRLVVKFKDGYIWESIVMDKDFTQKQMASLANYIFEKSSIKPNSVEFSPYE